MKRFHYLIEISHKGQGQQTYFEKGQTVTILGSVGHNVSITTIQLYHCWGWGWGVVGKSRPRQHINACAQLCLNKTLFVDTDFECYMIFMCHEILLSGVVFPILAHGLSLNTGEATVFNFPENEHGPCGQTGLSLHPASAAYWSSRRHIVNSPDPQLPICKLTVMVIIPKGFMWSSKA